MITMKHVELRVRSTPLRGDELVLKLSPTAHPKRRFFIATLYGHP
jgi:hypothetical protein